MSETSIPPDEMIARHLTALSRTQLSQPVALMLRYGLLREDRSFFDYGCGRGGDVEALREAGLAADGWDPHYRPDAERKEADVVNLGFVLNVIEDADERVDALGDAWRLSRGVLAVSTMLVGQASVELQTPFRDGYLTSRSTFQKYYSHSELRDLVERAVGVGVVAAAPGIFLAFRDRSMEEEFLFERHARGRPAFLAGPNVERPRMGSFGQRPIAERVEDVIEEIAGLALSRGRLPSIEELSPSSVARLRANRVPFRRASDLSWQTRIDRDAFVEAERQRREDLMVHAASCMLRGTPSDIRTGTPLGRDVRAIFTSRQAFADETTRFLFGLGDTGIMTRQIRKAVDAGIGLLDTKGRLVVSARRVVDLPGQLRCYVVCATVLVDDPGSDDVVRLDVARRRVSFLRSENLDDPSPLMTFETMVDLGRRTVRQSGRRRLLLRKAELFGDAASVDGPLEDVLSPQGMASDDRPIFSDATD